MSLLGWDQVIPRRFAYRVGRLGVVDRAAQCQWRACVDFFEDKRVGCRHKVLRVG